MLNDPLPFSSSTAFSAASESSKLTNPNPLFFPLSSAIICKTDFNETKGKSKDILVVENGPSGLSQNWNIFTCSQLNYNINFMNYHIGNFKLIDFYDIVEIKCVFRSNKRILSFKTSFGFQILRVVLHSLKICFSKKSKSKAFFRQYLVVRLLTSSYFTTICRS